MTSTPQTTQTAQRKHLLDVLRFGAAFAVVVYHFTATPTASQYWGTDVSTLFEGLNQVSRYGWLAVEAFFVISGLAILWSGQGRTLAQFTGSRVGRLYPALWACVLATAVLQAFWSGGRELSLGDTLLNLTMAPDLFGAELSQVVYWTLLVELKFYVLVGLLMLLGPLTRARALTLALAWPAAGMLVRGFGYPEVAEHLVVRHSVYFGIGMVLFLLWQDLAAHRDQVVPDGGTRRAVVVDLAALALLLGLSVDRVMTSADQASSLQGVPVHAGVAVLVLFAVVGAVWLAVQPWATVRNRYLAGLCLLAGALTYPLYLVHTQFGWAVTEVLAERGVGARTALVAATAVSLLLAAAIYYAVEKPCSAPLRRAVTRALAPDPSRRALAPAVHDGGTHHAREAIAQVQQSRVAA
ncbi:peptidoglycan/LPS O-acetylase OafA/YrhL [Isoptericola sp. CG 20/1183]|uniref:Peptidoglycan/LPS O-acetylase OafA/YrhL n=1 Tax=Isoptericola halotolerans TaxID=300560 RepID=A0ABX5EBP1_9MICO|nr:MULTISPECIES: acyltransferase [Isoptericola]PRZ04923.1 peptidoglycan/LPS O-acetylase OafA/YrhL [Isoptericola halotolerans]PRZ05414.1 peptidoglycan/LPS O-acetylase OafA/YrhL [Isoptericola sp. CG 20/1183]